MTRYDTIIHGGIFIDGLRHPRRRADVAIAGGRVAAVGRLPGATADRHLDADGLIVAPGFVDLHTHYDAQLFWDPYCSISGWHGVTSVVIGNCGFGFAPVRPGDREWAMNALARTEQVPYEVMKRVLPWTWESFPEFLDVLDAVPKGVNVLPYVPASPLLLYVMGEDAAYGRDATAEENRRMCRILDEAMAAGACGWSAQRVPPETYLAIQRDHQTRCFPSDTMSDATALALAEVLAARNEGFTQWTYFTADPMADRRHMEEVAATGARLVWNAVFPGAGSDDDVRDQIAWFDRCREAGLPLYAQGITTDPGMVFSLDIWNLWDANDAWRECLTGGVTERRARLSDPVNRERLRGDRPTLFPMESVVLRRTSLPEYEKYQGRPLTDIASAIGARDGVDALLDVSLAENLATVWEAPFAPTSEELLREMVRHPYIVPGVSDGGAHTKMITSGMYPTEHLAAYVRDRGWLSLEEMHWKLSSLPAHIAGFKDRGNLAVGSPADIVVYDYDRLRLLPDEVVHDLPLPHEWRRVRRAEGYRYILVNGQVTCHDGTPTGATPGHLLRHGRAGA